MVDRYREIKSFINDLIDICKEIEELNVPKNSDEDINETNLGKAADHIARAYLHLQIECMELNRP